MKVTVNMDVTFDTDGLMNEKELVKAFQAYTKDANKRSKELTVGEFKIKNVKK